MKIIGLSGTSGSGKFVAGRFFSAFGCALIDTDSLYHSMIEKDSECSRAIIEAFGEAVSNELGGIDRKKLSEIVFSDSEKLSLLNLVSHKYVKLACNEIIERERAMGRELAVIDAPQLFEADMQGMCDATVAVVADRDIRIKRICARDKISEERARARVDSQHTDAFFAENCDFVIENNLDVAHLFLSTKKVLDKIKGMN